MWQLPPKYKIIPTLQIKDERIGKLNFVIIHLAHIYYL